MATTSTLLCDITKPLKFEDIVDNWSVCDLFSGYIRSNYLPNILISGPHGCGKSTIVDILVKQYLKTYEKDACMRLYGSIYRGKHIISEFLSKKFSDKGCIEPNIVSFIKKQMFLPDDITRVIIIYDFDCMTEEAQMALRRVIEQYSYRVRFIFICNDRSKIIEALQSRTITIDLNSISTLNLIATLKSIAEASEASEMKSLDDEIYDLIGIISNGDLKYAINILQYFSKSPDKSVDSFYKLFNLQPIPEIIKIVKHCKQGQLKSAFSILDSLLTNGFNVQDLTFFLIKMLYAKIIVDTEYIEILVQIIYRLENSPSHIHLYELICKWINTNPKIV